MNSTAPPAILLETTGPIARLTLDRPERHNALRAVDVDALLAALDRVESDTAARVLVLTGSGERTFCAGAALEEMESGAMSGRIFDGLTDRLEHFPLPTICALNGSVYGGGAELALCCDFRLGTPGTRLSVPAARLGVCYPVGGLGRYLRRVGQGAAARILLAAEELDAEELLRNGYLTHLVDRAELEAETGRLAERLASLAPLAVRAMKRILGAISEGALAERPLAEGAPLTREQAERIVDEVAASDDTREGLRATLERRDPDFRGR